MTLELFAGFVVASTVLLIIPGPTILLIITYALSEGRRAAFSTVAGTVVGDILAVTASLAGLGAVLATSATLFTVLKWLGAAYLVYLGLRMILARPEPATELQTEPAAPEGRSQRSMFTHAFLVTSLNPKSIVFFVAFLPQFVAPGAPVLPQMVLLGGTFVFLALLVCAAYALVASEVRGAILRPAVLRRVNALGGGALVAAGLLVAASRRPD